MLEVILLVEETPEALELQKKMVELLEKEFGKEAIVLPGGIKRPKIVEEEK